MKSKAANRFIRTLSAPLLLGAVVVCSSQSALAANLYWDTDGNTAGSGAATGTWGTDTFWSADITGASATANTLTTLFDDLFFSAGTNGTGGTITVDSTRNARLLTLEEGALTFSGGTIHLGTGGGITVLAGAGDGIVSSNLTLSGGQTFNVGTVRILTLNTGTFTRNAGATLNIQGAGTVNTTMTNLATGSLVNGIIGPWASFGTGSSTKYATIDGSNNIVGLTGTSVGATGVTSTAGTVNYDVTGGGTMGASASVNTLRYTGGSATLTTATAFTTNGLMNAGSGLLTISGTVTIGGTKELVVNSANADINISNVIANNGGAPVASALTKTGSGALILNGINTYTGATTLNAGRLVVNQNGSLGAGTVLTIAGGILDSSSNGSRTLTNNPTQTWSGDFSFGGQAVINGGMGGRNLNLGTGAVTLTGNRTVTVDSNTGIAARATSNNQLIVGGDISGAFTLTKAGAGTLSLTDTTQTFNGGLLLNGGALRVAADAGWNANTLTFGGGVLEFNYAPAASYTLGTSAGQLNLAGGGGFSAFGGGRSVTLAGGPITWGTTANFVGASNALKFGSLTSDNALTLTNAIDLGGATRTIDATRGTNSSFTDGILSGAITNGSINKTGNGSVSLTNTGSSLSAVTISGGTLGMNTTTFSNTNVLLNGGAYQTAANYTGALGLGNGQLRFAGGSADGGFSADGTNKTFNIGGAGATLTWNSTTDFLGTGALLLNSSASGGTTILTNGLGLNGADRTIYVEDGSAAIDARIDGIISGTGGLIKTGGSIASESARLFLSGANSYTGATTIRQGDVLINNSVLNNTNSPLGNSASTIFLTDASSLSGESGTSNTLWVLRVQGLTSAGAADAAGDTKQFTIERPINVSGANTTNILGRTRIGLFGNGGSGLDTNKLTLSGNITLGGRALELYAERAGQTIEVTSPSITGSGTIYLTGNIGSNSATDGRSNGTFRFSNQARSFSNAINVTYGTLVIEGSVAATGNSPIGTAGLSLADGNGGNTLQGSAPDAVRSVFMETAGTSYARTLSPGGFGSMTPSAGAQQTLYGDGATNLGNGYRFGGLNTSGTVTFSGAITPGGVSQSVRGTAGGSGGTNALTVVHNIALMSANGGTVDFTGAISGSIAPALGNTAVGGSNNTGNLTRITINQFRNHPHLDGNVDGAADPGVANALVGTATGGTVVMSGSNTYGASTEILGGTLRLNYATTGGTNTSKLSDTAALILSGGTLDLSGVGGTHTEVVGSTTITGNTLNSISRSSGTSILRLNSLNRGLGGFLNFGAPSIADTDTTNTNGILGAWATINGTDWAINSTNAADGAITAYTAYTNIDALGSTISDGSSTNVRINAAGSGANIALGASPTTVNTLLQNTGTAATVDTATKILRTTGIMIGSGQQALTIGANANDGTLTSATSAAGSELLLQNFSSNGLTVNSVVADNTTAGNLTVGGSGKTTLKGANTYTGSTLISSGVLNIQNATALGGLSASVTSSIPAVTALAPGNVGQAIINTTSTTGLTVGQAISGPGIPAGSYITAIVANTSFTVSQNLTSAASTVAGAYQVGGTAVANGAALELQGGIAVGAEALTLAGSGILNGGALRNISGNNSYAGTINLTADTRINSDSGTLTLSGGIPSPAVATSAYALTFGGAGNTTVSGIIDISPAASGYLSSLTKDGLGTLILSANNTYGGPTTISAGTLQLGSGGTTGKLAATSRITNNGTFVINRSNTVTQGTDFGSLISGTGGVTLNGTSGGNSILDLNAANTYDGLTTINIGVLNASNANALGSTVGGTRINYNGTSTTGGRLDITGGAGSITIDENITVAGGRLTSDYTSGFRATGGTVNLTNTLIIDGTTNGSEIRVGSENTGTVLNFQGGVSRTGALTTGGGNLLFKAGNNSTINFNGAIDNNGGMVEFTDGLNVLNVASTLVGNIQIDYNGTVKLGVDNAFPAASQVRIGLNTGSTSTDVNAATGKLDMAGKNLSVARIEGSNGASTATTASRKITNSTSGNSLLTIGGTGNQTFDGVIENGGAGGTVAITKQLANTQTFSGTVANTYTGLTTVNGGSLILAKTAGINAIAGNLTIGDGTGNDIVQLTNSNQIADTSVVTFNGSGANAGILRLNNQSETLAGLSSTGGAGIVENESGSAATGTLMVNIASGSQSFSGMLRDGDGTGTDGTLAFTKDGAGTQILTGTNTYTGATTVSAGTLLVNGSLGSSEVTVNAGASFGGSGTYGGNLNITGGAFHVVDLFDALQVLGVGKTINIYAGFGVDDLTGITWDSVANDTYTLIDGTLGTGVFAALNHNSLATAYDIGGSRSAYFKEGSLQLVVIPEPRAALLGLIGMLALLRRRR